MRSINVISIDPAQSAKSALHPEVFERIARECRFSRDVKNYNVSAQKSINLAFGINKKTTKAQSRNLFILRSLAGAGFIACGLIQGIELSSFSSSWVLLIMGVAMIFGLFTRSLSLLSVLFFSYIFAAAGLELSFMGISSLSTVAVSIAFFALGPGKYSVDQLIRRALIKYSKKRAKINAEKLASLRLSYKAMRYV